MKFYISNPLAVAVLFFQDFVFLEVTNYLILLPMCQSLAPI